MLDNIRAYYFTQKIFSYLIDERILKIAKYNKSLQKKINIGIINLKCLVENILYMSQME